MGLEIYKRNNQRQCNQRTGVRMKRHNVLLTLKKKSPGTSIAITLSGVQCIFHTRNFCPPRSYCPYEDSSSTIL